jgi:hypothetical protein
LEEKKGMRRHKGWADGIYLALIAYVSVILYLHTPPFPFPPLR